MLLEPGTVISARTGVVSGTISMRSGSAIKPKIADEIGKENSYQRRGAETQRIQI
jgi:hypothetical protein